LDLLSAVEASLRLVIGRVRFQDRKSLPQNRDKGQIITTLTFAKVYSKFGVAATRKNQRKPSQG
jgi:hypothetical protein